MSRRLPRDDGWRLFLRTAIGRAYPRVIGAQREWAGMIFDVGLPLIGLSAYVFVYRAIGAPEAFVGFVILGGAMSAFWLNVLWAMSSQFFWEKETGNLALYIIAPGSLLAILLGMALGGMIYAALRATVIVTLGSWLFAVQYDVSSVPMLLIVFVLTLTALYGMGAMFASLFLLFGREAWHLVNLSQEPVYLLSGMYFPIGSLHVWVAASASIIPLTLGLDAMRQIVFASGPPLGFLDVRVEAAALLVLTILFIGGARVALRHMERLAVAHGRVTESRA